MVRWPAPFPFAISAFPITSVVSAPNGQRGRQQDLGRTAVNAPGPAGRHGEPVVADPADRSGPAVAVRSQRTTTGGVRHLPGLHGSASIGPGRSRRSQRAAPFTNSTLAYYTAAGKGPVGVAGQRFTARAVVSADEPVPVMALTEQTSLGGR